MKKVIIGSGILIVTSIVIYFTVFSNNAKNLQITGKIKDNHYTAINGVFSCEIPFTSQAGLVIQDSENGVSFSDDFGGLYRIEWLKDNGLVGDFEKLTKEAKTERLVNLFKKAYFPSTQGLINGSKVIKQDYLKNIPYFNQLFVVYLPKGSTLVDMKSGERFNARRTVVTFIKGEYLYYFTTQLSDLFGKSIEDNLDIDNDKKELTDFINNSSIK